MTARWWLAAALLLGARSLEAQRVGFGVHAAHLALKEGTADREWSGPGFGGSATLRVGPVEAELWGSRVSLEPGGSDTTLAPFDLTVLDAIAAVRVYRFLDLEGGLGRRWASPELSVEDVGYLRVGVRVQSALDQRNRVWARADYLPVVRFSGGGTAGLSMEMAFGFDLGLGNRFALRGDYVFQRTDHESNGQDWPTQTWTARLGAAVFVP